MKVYLKNNGKYILINEEGIYTNEEDYYKKQDFINEAMDKLEKQKLTMEIIHQQKADYKVKKLVYSKKNVA